MPGMVRISFGYENNQADVDRVVTMLHRIVRGDYSGTYEVEAGSGDYSPVGYTEEWADYFSLRSSSTTTPQWHLI